MSNPWVVSAVASSVAFVSIVFLLRHFREQEKQENQHKEKQATGQTQTQKPHTEDEIQLLEDEERRRMEQQTMRGRRRSSFGPMDKSFAILQRMAMQARSQREKEDVEFLTKVLVGTGGDATQVEEDNVLKPNTKQWILEQFSRPHAHSSAEEMPPPSARPQLTRIKSEMMLKRGGVQTMLMNIDSFISFDTCALASKTHNHALQTLAWFLLHRWGCVSRFSIDPKRLEQFLNRVEDTYNQNNNPYHNAVHAADVLQATHCFLVMGMRQYFSEIEVFALLLSAIVHDLDHDGKTNNFHENILSPRAIQHNGISIQESHHVATTFTILKDDQCNILHSLSTTQFKEVRKIIIDSVLATDMRDHFHHVKALEVEVGSRGTDPKDWPHEDRQILRSLTLHLADLSNPLRPVPVCEKWAKLVLEEMFQQGDNEKQRGLTVSALCDRDTTELSNSQIGFLKHVVKPFVASMAATVLPALKDEVIPTMEDNERFWELRKATPRSQPSSDNNGSGVNDGLGTGDDDDDDSGDGDDARVGSTPPETLNVNPQELPTRGSNHNKLRSGVPSLPLNDTNDILEE